MPRQITFSFLLIFFTLPAFAEERVDDFLEAAKTGDTKVIRTLLAAGVDVQAGDWAGWPALNWAALMLQNETIEILLDAGADIEYLAKGGKNSGRPERRQSHEKMEDAPDCGEPARPRHCC
jgi:hypothetical protein